MYFLFLIPFFHFHNLLNKIIKKKNIKNFFTTKSRTKNLFKDIFLDIKITADEENKIYY